MERYDIVIVGAGTAGMPCAIEAVEAGARVLVVEQEPRYGGTLHVSLGQMSGAGSRLQAERGIVDDARTHLDDIVRINRDTGRADILRRTLPMQGSTIDWLMDLGFEMDPACPAILHLHEAYRTARTYWGVDGGLSILKAVAPLFDRAMAAPNAELRFATRASRLLTDDRCAVRGVALETADGKPLGEVAARAVILATGGYGANAGLFARLTDGRPLYTAAMPGSTGAGIEMAMAAGAGLVGHDLFLPTYAGIVSRPGDNRIVWRQMPSLTPQVRLPWELHLDPTGRRFVREDDESVDAREHALNALPALTFWCVFDDAILEAAPPLLPGWTAEELRDAWESHPSFVVAEAVDTLADATGMDVEALRDSLTAYADACRGVAPDPMGRRHCPLPIGGPRFRAVKMHGIVLKTPAGIHVNDAMEACRADGEPIPGLYAVGEAIGGSTLSGKGFVSGMSVTPALTLGRWLGRTLGAKLTARETT